MSHRTPFRLTLGALALSACGFAQAGEVYASLGVPGLMLGYAHPVNDKFTVRADLTTIGSHSKRQQEDGIDYDGNLKADRVGLFGDWYPFQNGFRLTGGLTFNDYRLSLKASGAGGLLTVGDTTYSTTAADGLDAAVKFASTTPYLGIGWGHHLDQGLRFSVDLGAMIGHASVDVKPRGVLASEAAQADVAKETRQLEDGVGKVQAIPQLTLSVGYSF